MVNQPLVSSSWHRVAGLRASLVPGLRVVRQRVRGQAWHVLVEPGSGRQLRLNPAAYELVARFDGRATVDALWQRQLEQHRDDAPTQDEVLRLLAQLFRGGMLRFDAAPHLSLLFARRGEEVRQRRRGMMNPLVLRMPLLDPQPLLQALAPLGRALFRPAAFVAWLAAVLAALLAAGAHASELLAGARRLFATPSNYLVAWLAYPAVKLLHELGHGLAVRRYGGEVHELGVSLIFLTPAPYVDATAANAFPAARARLVVSAAGILVETGIASLALAAWLALSPGLARDTMLVVALICSVSTVLFNANPLVRFDGYHVLCDALQLPNLALRSQAWWSRRWRAWVGAPVPGPGPLLAPGEAKWLVAYAPAALAYRLALLLALVAWVGQQSWLLGWAAALALAAWGARLAGRWAAGDGTEPRVRRRSLAVAAALLAVVAVLLFAVPAPHTVVARGIVWPPDNAQVRAGAGGFVERLALPHGGAVGAGQLLLDLRDPVLETARERIVAERNGLLAQQYQALLQQPVRAAEIAEDLLRNDAELARVDEQLAQLAVRAQLPGRVVWSRPQDLPAASSGGAPCWATYSPPARRTCAWRCWRTTTCARAARCARWRYGFPMRPPSRGPGGWRRARRARRSTCRWPRWAIASAARCRWIRPIPRACARSCRCSCWMRSCRACSPRRSAGGPGSSWCCRRSPSACSGSPGRGSCCSSSSVRRDRYERHPRAGELARAGAGVGPLSAVAAADP